jgi:lysophospholipase L1-like esterase
MVVALLALLAFAPAARAAGQGGVLVVGDSLEELTSPYLQKYLPGIPLTVNAVGGSNSYQIYDLFRESYDPSQSVIVFDAGTNDNPEYPQILEENLHKVAATVGGRCMVVPTVHGFTVNGHNNDGKNRAVAEFAASRPGTQVPDWAHIATTRPDLMQADGLHPIEAGADLRAQMIAQGVLSCFAYEEAEKEQAAAAAAAPEVKPVHLQPVRRFADRRDSLFETMAGDVIRQAAAVAVVQMLLPGR